VIEPTSLPGEISLHASAVVVGEAGVIVHGRSGRGKSALVLAMIALASDRRVFARLVGDDRVSIRARHGRLLVTGAPRISGLIERRGAGLETAPSEACAVARLVVDLLDEGRRIARLPEPDDQTIELGGVTLPRLAFDETTGPVERAEAALAGLARLSDRFVTRKAHFA
jgi:HPr kinase/phosphorylase